MVVAPHGWPERVSADAKGTRPLLCSSRRAKLRKWFCVVSGGRSWAARESAAGSSTRAPCIRHGGETKSGPNGEEGTDERRALTRDAAQWAPANMKTNSIDSLMTSTGSGSGGRTWGRTRAAPPDHTRPAGHARVSQRTQAASHATRRTCVSSDDLVREVHRHGVRSERISLRLVFEHSVRDMARGLEGARASCTSCRPRAGPGR
jgi:hypothetical protein